MKKFKEKPLKIGDKVKLTRGLLEPSIEKGTTGVIVQIDEDNFVTEYTVSFERVNVCVCSTDWLELVEEAEKPSGKIKSNGLSSSYYDLPISDKLLEALNKRKEDGQCYVKVEDMIDEFFDGLFNQGTLFKSLVRAHLQTKGEGKAGNDLEYEINKVIYYANKIKEKGCE